MDRGGKERILYFLPPLLLYTFSLLFISCLLLKSGEGRDRVPADSPFVDSFPPLLLFRCGQPSRFPPGRGVELAGVRLARGLSPSKVFSFSPLPLAMRASWRIKWQGHVEICRSFFPFPVDVFLFSYLFFVAHRRSDMESRGAKPAEHLSFLFSSSFFPPPLGSFPSP